MSELNSLWKEYGQQEKNILKFQEDPETCDSLQERIITKMEEIFSREKGSSLGQILDLIEVFIALLGIPFLLLLNKSALIPAIIEFLQNTNRSIQSETKTLFDIWRHFYYRFRECAKKFPESEEIKNFISLDNYLQNNYSSTYQTKYSELSKKSKEFTEFEKLFLSIFEKNLQAEKLINGRGTDADMLFEMFEKFNQLSLPDIFSSNYKSLESEILIQQGKKSISLKNTLKSSIDKMDPSLTKKLYSPEKSLHNCEYYIEDTEFPMKNDLTTHFLEDGAIFFDISRVTNLKALICGFLNAQGGRIYIGLVNGRIEGLYLTPKDQDDFRLQIDEGVRGFSPTVPAEDFKTHFYPVFSKNFQFNDIYVVKIIIRPTLKDVTFTSKPESKVFVRQENGLEKDYMKEWQNLFFSKQKNEKTNIKLYNDPKPADPKLVKPEWGNLNQRSVNYHYLETGEWPQRKNWKEKEQRNNWDPEWDQRNNWNPSSDKKVHKPYDGKLWLQEHLDKMGHEQKSSEKGQKTKNEVIKEANQMTNEKLTEQKIKQILEVDKNSERKKPRKIREDSSLLYNVLFVKYESKTPEKNFIESTFLVSELFIDFLNGQQPKLQLRRKDKKYFFIETEKEIEDETIEKIKECFESGEFKNTEFSFPKKEMYLKQKSFVLAK